MARAENRHHVERMKRRVRGFRRFDGLDEKFFTPRVVGSVATTPQACSCYLCRNPRRGVFHCTKDRLTRQEHEAALAEREQRREVA